MSKVRVHELAKEFGLENKEVLDRLQAAGFSVKTHSSSVFADEARRALSGPAAPAAAPKRRRPGMRIVKRGAKSSSSESSSASPSASAASETAQEQGHTAATSNGVAAPQTSSRQTPAVVQDEALPAAVTAHAETVEREASGAKEVTSEVSEVAVAVADAPASAQGGQTEAGVAKEAASPSSTHQTTSAAQAKPAASTQAAGAPNTGNTGAAPADGVRKGSKVLRMIDRSKLLERVPSNRLGGEHNRPHGGGGARNFGQVRELKVVNDPFGRGREMVAVNRNQKGPKGRRPAGGRDEGRRGGRGMRERSSFPSRLRRRKPGGGRRNAAPLPPTRAKEAKRIVRMDEEIAISDLAHQLQSKAIDIVRLLVKMGTMVRVTDRVDFDTASLVAEEYGFKVQSTAFDESEFISEAEAADNEVDTSGWDTRPPVVTVMGHVDHGKTSLLDTIKKSRVTAGEAGGITQHIGAYSVPLEGRGQVTFLDTPGHAAFSAMRARGANTTDIVVLVVAADDGVMPQTKEAIKHAKAAEVPIVVAVNKIDKPDANPDRVMQELSQFDLVPEAWGGDTLYVNTSATKGIGIDELLDALLLQAEVLELSADPKADANGLVVEARLDKGRGAVATVLVKHGLLKRGDAIVVGESYGKIRAMTDHLGKAVKEAKPSDAVEIIGLNTVPRAGDAFNKVASVDDAKQVSEYRAQKRQDSESNEKRSANALLRKLSGKTSTLYVIAKADVQGSLEALLQCFEQLPNDEVQVEVIHKGVGAISESDIAIAAAGSAKIVGFNVKADAKAQRAAQKDGVAIHSYKVIYELLDDIRGFMEELLAPETKEVVIGRAEVREVFRIAKFGFIAGSRVVSGKAVRGARVRVMRNGKSVYEGKVNSLKHYKDDVRTVDSGSECGIGVDGYDQSQAGDVIEFYELEEIKRTLSETRI